MGTLKIARKRMKPECQYCHDNILFWRSPEGGDLNFAQIARKCDLKENAVVYIARRVEAENGMEKGSLTKKQNNTKGIRSEKKLYCHDNILFWRSPEGGDLNFTQIGKICGLDKSTVKNIARKVEAENGLPKYSLTKNQNMSAGLRRSHEEREENNMGRRKNVDNVSTENMEGTTMNKTLNNSQKSKILREAKNTGLGYEDVAVKLGVETNAEVDLAIQEVIVKPDEVERMKKAFAEASKTKMDVAIKEFSTPTQIIIDLERIKESATVKELIKELGEPNEKNIGDWLYNLVAQGDDLRGDIYDLETDFKDYKRDTKKELSALRSKANSFAKEAEALKEEFGQKLDNLVEQKTTWIFDRITVLEDDADPANEKYSQLISDCKKCVNEFASKYSELYGMWKQIEKTIITIDLTTGQFFAPEGKEDLVVEDTNNEIYHEIMDDCNPIFDLDRPLLRIVAQARAIIINAKPKIEFIDKDGNPLPENILRAIEV